MPVSQRRAGRGMRRSAPNGVPLAERMAGIALSEIVAISEQVARMKAQGRDVVKLSTGEPDFPTPEFIIEAALRAARDGQTTYPPTAGIPALREAIALEHSRMPVEVIVSTGAKQVLANALLATLDPGDEVILPAPFWTSYADMVRLAGGVGVTVPCAIDQGFKLTPDALEAAITPRTRWLILNSPSNPSGAIYTAAEIAALAKVLDRHSHVWVISDEIYSHLNYAPFVSFTTAAPAMVERCLIVSGVSKAWSMTGWRIGWGVGPAALIKAMAVVQGQLTSGASSIGQAAALAALTGHRQFLEERRNAYRTRRDKVVAALNAIAGIDCPAPDGAFFVFPACSAGDAVCTDLLDQAGVAVVPGSAFGLPGHFRLSFAYADDALDEGLNRIRDFLGGK